MDMMKSSRQHSRRKGQSMVEFALILCLVAVEAITTIAMTGNQLAMTYQDIEEAITNPGDPGAESVYTCPDGTPAVMHGHKYHCH